MDCTHLSANINRTRFTHIVRQVRHVKCGCEDHQVGAKHGQYHTVARCVLVYAVNECISFGKMASTSDDQGRVKCTEGKDMPRCECNALIN